jgi:soluble lytic murein transglycosylase
MGRTLTIVIVAATATLMAAPAWPQTTPSKTHPHKKTHVKKTHGKAPAAHRAPVRKHTAKPTPKKPLLTEESPRAALGAPPSKPSFDMAEILPGAVKGEEAAHVKRYDAAIAQARNLVLSSDDAARLREAIGASGRSKIPHVKALRAQISDPIARKLIDWYLFRGGYGTASEIRAFVEANPAWPDQALLRRRAEEALLVANAKADEIKAFFGASEPVSGSGLAALASAFAAEHEEARAKTLAVKAWVEYDVPASIEPVLLERIGSLLTEEDHKHRLDRLLLDDSRWAGERKERAVVIRRVIALLSKPEKQQAEARLAVFLRAKNGAELLAKLPAEAQSTWGVAIQKAQALRRQNKDEQAWKILLDAPQAPMRVKPEGWWEERRAAAYAALKAGKPKIAYELAAGAKPLPVNASKDAAFLAGWLALRKLGDAKLAQQHFLDLQKEADGPLSRARALYWLGRTSEALADREKAREYYRAASNYIDTFHGQLARLKLDPDGGTLDLKPPAAPTAEEVSRFNGTDAVKAAVFAHKAGLDASIERAFLFHLRNYFDTEAEVAMVAHLAEAFGDTQTAVRVGKTGVARGMNLIYYAYPIHALPAYTPLRGPPEPAFILGIARQESEFNTRTLSGAGARGILQVMPITARHVCHDYKIKCDIKRLMQDPAYNTMMGSAYISDRVEEFSGSYILAIAGYNAGPGRARQWIREFGDPRDGRIDPIDWILRIPFEETREYVQKVLSNIQIYRARLGDEANAVRLTADLHRASAGTAPTDAAATSTAAK